MNSKKSQRLKSAVCAIEKSLIETENAFRKRGRRMVLKNFHLFLVKKRSVRDVHEDEHNKIPLATCHTRRGRWAFPITMCYRGCEGDDDFWHVIVEWFSSMIFMIFHHFSCGNFVSRVFWNSPPLKILLLYGIMTVANKFKFCHTTKSFCKATKRQKMNCKFQLTSFTIKHQFLM